jgi:HEAT repeat protein
MRHDEKRQAIPMSYRYAWNRFPTTAVGVAAIVVICLFTSSEAWSQQTATQDLAAAERVIERLRDLPTPLPIVGNGVGLAGQPLPIPESEIIRDAAYRELHRLGPAAVTVLARAYHDPDEQLRRNVALALLVLSGGIWPGLDKVDVSLALPELTAALGDVDPDVRAWSAQAIGMIGPAARPAVSALIRLLDSADEGSRNSACIALRGVGPAAGNALPALRRALSDRSTDVRKFARRAILAIEG